MSKALIFGGTTEGRELAEALARSGVEVRVCVALEYGAQVVPESERIEVIQGRLDAAEMRRLYETFRPDVVVDATHPYATLVTSTIKESLEGLDVPYLRLLRPPVVDVGSGCSFYESMSECADALRSKAGRILLATGTKELGSFCDDPSLRERLIVRVLPSLESLKICFDAGLQGRQIVAMQGPFTRETNEATLRQYGARYLVSKESGEVGGEDAKLQAARSVGVEVCLIRRPDATDESGLSANEVYSQLEQLLKVKIVDDPVDVALAGVGCGAPELMTEEVRARIESSDYLFGSPRIMRLAVGNAARSPVFAPDEIVKALKQIKAKRGGGKRVTVLFSGDPGLYSGCGKVYAALRELEGIKVRVMPGVSSITTLAARLGLAWQDAAILSLHGVAESDWAPKLKVAATENAVTLLLTSGAADVRKAASLLATLPRGKEELRVVVGRNLSYQDEQILNLSLDECSDVDGEGLYVVAVLQERPRRRVLVPTISDDAFLRDKVPMTKEKVRKLAICQLKLEEGDVVYDVGAGTGSISIQTALTSPTVRVCAIERDPGAVELIRRNIAAFGVENVEVVQGDAPDALGALPKANRAFIGGAGGELEPILERLYAINPEMRVVMTAVSLESVGEMTAAVKRLPIEDLDVAQIAITQIRRLGAYTMPHAKNPVYIFSFNFTRE
ncbi:MAG: precorrin-6A reductase [Thermoguttaceae bacterium]|jgi:precorrin-6Y C5,15-methyltransferase (decarboxylating)